MSDMSSLSHEYASAADFSRALNEAALLLKKRFAHADRDAETDAHRSAVHRLREILSNLLRRLADAGEAGGEQGETAIPEDVLARIVEEHRGELAYLREDIGRPLAALAQSLRAIGHASHCVDRERGVRRNGQRIGDDIQAPIDPMRAIAQEEDLSQRCLERIEQAERVAPTMRATIAFVSGYVRHQVRQ